MVRKFLPLLLHRLVWLLLIHRLLYITFLLDGHDKLPKKWCKGCRTCTYSKVNYHIPPKTSHQSLNVELSSPFQRSVCISQVTGKKIFIIILWPDKSVLQTDRNWQVPFVWVWQALLEEKAIHHLLRKENILVITLSIASLVSVSLVQWTISFFPWLWNWKENHRRTVKRKCLYLVPVVGRCGFSHYIFQIGQRRPVETGDFIMLFVTSNNMWKMIHTEKLEELR